MRNLIIKVCTPIPSPDGRLQTVISAYPGHSKQVNGLSVDDCMRSAKKIVKEMGLAIRSANFTADGDIQIIVWKDRAPELGKLPGMVFKKPPAQPPS